MKDIINSEMRLASPTELDLKKTFECGQCFRWNEDPRGGYVGVVRGIAARVWTREDGIFIDAEEDAFREVWFGYFDLGRDYSSIEFGNAGEYFEDCARFGAGIRILRQEPWETLCSFIISQCNNIPRIKKIIEELCRRFGEEIDYDGRKYYSFPGAEAMAALSEKDLEPLHCGYRAAYIISAARAVAIGEINFDELFGLERKAAVKALMSLYGVGEKVANCVALYGLHMISGFPVDVWMKRALRENFPKGFEPAVFGPCAGLAQQYIFYYARSNSRIREK